MTLSGSERPLHVMILHAPTDLAGAEGVILNINRFVDKARVRIFNCPFINFTRGRNQYLEELEDRGIQYDAIPLVKRFEYRYISETRKLIEGHKIDVIHSHGYRSDITALLAAQGKIPVVSTLHGFTGNNLRIKSYEFFQQLVLKYMDTLIPVSDSIEEKLLSWGIPPERIHKLPNIVDIERLVRLEQSSLFSELKPLEGEYPGTVLRMAYVGRLSEEKGLDILIHACVRLKAIGIPFLLVIAGDGPLRKKHENLAESLNLGNDICFLGFRRDAAEIIAASDVLVLPSRTEGTPLVVLEAMALGIPVVASRVGGLAKLVKSPSHGMLFESGNIRELADSLCWISRHRTGAREMGDHARQEIRKSFDPQRWISDLTDVYYSAFQRRSHKIKILTNHPGQTESKTWRLVSTRVPVREKGLLPNFRVAVEMYLRHWKYDAVVLGGGRSDTIYAIIQSLLPFGKKPTIMIDCLWYESSNKLKGLLKILLFRIMNRSVDRYVVWASREIKAYAATFSLPEEKLVFIPYHTTLDNYSLTPTDEGYLFSGGNFARDYGTLIEAVRGLPVKLLIACTRPELFRDISLPDNVIVKGFTHEEYLGKMAGCTMNIVPLASGLLHSGGQQTFLNSMFLGKPTIVTDPQGAKDYITHNINGLLVEPNDYETLREAILQVLDNPQEGRAMGEKAREKIQDLTTETHFRKIVALAEEVIKKTHEV